jgi:hypothetical protein
MRVEEERISNNGSPTALRISLIRIALAHFQSNLRFDILSGRILPCFKIAYRVGSVRGTEWPKN